MTAAIETTESARLPETPSQDTNPEKPPLQAPMSRKHGRAKAERKTDRTEERTSCSLAQPGCDLPRCPAPEHKHELASKGARQFRVSTKLGVFADCAILCSTVSKDSKHVRSQSLVSRRTPRLAMFTAPSSTFLRWVLTGCLQHDCNDEAAQSNYTEGMCRDQCKAPPIIYLTPCVFNHYRCQVCVWLCQAALGICSGGKGATMGQHLWTAHIQKIETVSCSGCSWCLPPPR